MGERDLYLCTFLIYIYICIFRYLVDCNMILVKKF